MIMNKKLIVMAGLMIGLTASYANADLIDGLRNYWNFDDNLVDQAHGMEGSASTVQDDGEFRLDPILEPGIDFGTGKFGGDIEQNGSAEGFQSDGYVEIFRSDDTLFGTNSVLTTSMWVRADGFDTGWQTIVSHGEGSQYRFARAGSESGLSYAGGHTDISGLPDVTLGTWHHLLGITDAANGTRLYFDGVLAGENTADAAVLNDDQNTLGLWIGANPDTGFNNREWLGGIDDVAQWERALSDAEVLQIYNGGVNGQSLAEVLVATPGVAGDANGDGNFDFGDIEAFFLALTDAAAYAAAYPDVAISLLDMNADGNTDFGDIDAFFVALTAG